MAEEIVLGDCFCGNPATWYRIAPPASGASREEPVSDVSEENRQRKSFGSIGIDDVEGNICDSCIKGFTGSLDSAPPGWKRIDMLGRQRRAGEESQERRYRDYEGNDSPDDFGSQDVGHWDD